jgi:DUF4097 and DUF4098 domain-containing protein YvlB
MFGQHSEYREEFSITKPASGHTEFSLNNINGSVNVTGVEGLTEIQITGVKTVKDASEEEAKGHIGDIRIDVQESGAALNGATHQPDSRGGRSYTVDYEIRVPGSWKVIVENTNGNVEVRALHNGIKATLTNGNLRANDVSGNLNASVTNGEINADGRVPENAACRLETVNGTIRGKLDLAKHVHCNLQTVNGGIALSVPQSISSRVAADAMVGSIKASNLSLQNSNNSRVNFTGQKLNGTLGAGEGEIRLAVQNGSIVLSGF